MKVGLLIFDDDSRYNLAEKVRRAARQYKRKFREAPDICHVHPSEFTAVPPGETVAAQALVGGVEVIASSTTLRHHFLIERKENQVNDNANPVVNGAPAVAPTP